MSILQFTPGPWHYEEEHGGKAGVYASYWTEKQGLFEQPDEEQIICDVTDEDVGSAQLAGNLELVAFAPTMYKLLAEAVHDLGQRAMPSKEWMDAVRGILGNLKPCK